MAGVAAVAGEDSLLRRWIFNISATSASASASTHEYPSSPSKLPRSSSSSISSSPPSVPVPIPIPEITSFFILTNGYSIAQYTIDPDPGPGTAAATTAKNLDLGKIQHSWDNARHRYEESLGPLRENDRRVAGLRVKRWLLKRTWIDEKRNGNAHQVYVNEEGKGKGRERSVVEVVWLKQ